MATATKVRSKAVKGGNGKARVTDVAPVAATRKWAKVAAEVPAPAPEAAPARPRPTAGERGAKRLAETFKLAGDATRLRVLTLLAAKGGSNVGDMAREFEMGQPALSHHLALCRHSGVIEATRRGKTSVYTLTPKGEILARMALELGSAE